MNEQQINWLKNKLYNDHRTTSVDEEDPYVGIFFNDLIDLINEFNNKQFDNE